MTYFNTNHLEGEELEKAKRKNNVQEKMILQFFEENPESYYAPHQIKEMVLPESLITSVRRAMTNLTKRDELLIKTDEMIDGPNGKPVHTWTLKYEKT